MKKKKSNFLSKYFQFLVVKFSIYMYLNRRVFVTKVLNKTVAHDSYYIILYYIILYYIILYYIILYYIILYYIILYYIISHDRQPASVAQLDAPSDWTPGDRGFNPRRGRQHSFVEIDNEIFSTVILSLLLIQEGQLSVSGDIMCTLSVYRLED